MAVDTEKFPHRWRWYSQDAVLQKDDETTIDCICEQQESCKENGN